MSNRVVVAFTPFRCPGGLVEKCAGHSIFAEVEGQVVVRALTISAIAATNQMGAPGIGLERANSRLYTVNEQVDIGALRSGIMHYQREWTDRKG